MIKTVKEGVKILKKEFRKEKRIKARLEKHNISSTIQDHVMHGMQIVLGLSDDEFERIRKEAFKKGNFRRKK